MNHPEWKIPFLEECGMNWDEIKDDYVKRMENEKQRGIDKIREQFDKAINELTSEEVDAIEDGKIPNSISKIADLDPVTFNFVSKIDNSIVLGTIYDILEAQDFQKTNKNNNIELAVETQSQI